MPNNMRDYDKVTGEMTPKQLTPKPQVKMFRAAAM